MAVYPDRLILYHNAWPQDQVVVRRAQIASTTAGANNHDTDAVDIIVEMRRKDRHCVPSRVWSKASPPMYWYTYAGGTVRGERGVEALAGWLESRSECDEC